MPALDDDTPVIAAGAAGAPGVTSTVMLRAALLLFLQHAIALDAQTLDAGAGATSLAPSVPLSSSAAAASGAASGRAAGGHAAPLDPPPAFVGRLLHYVLHGTCKAGASAFLLEVLAEAVEKAAGSASILGAKQRSAAPAQPTGNAAVAPQGGQIADGLCFHGITGSNGDFDALCGQLAAALSKTAFQATPQLRSSVLDSCSRLLVGLCEPTATALPALLALPLPAILGSGNSARGAGTPQDASKARLLAWLRAAASSAHCAAEVAALLETALSATSVAKAQSLGVLLAHAPAPLLASSAAFTAQRHSDVAIAGFESAHAPAYPALAAALLQFGAGARLFAAEGAGPLGSDGREVAAARDALQSLVLSLLDVHAGRFTLRWRYDRAWCGGLQALVSAARACCSTSGNSSRAGSGSGAEISAPGGGISEGARCLALGVAKRLQRWATSYIEPALPLLAQESVASPEQRLCILTTAQAVCSFFFAAPATATAVSITAVGSGHAGAASWPLFGSWAAQALPHLLATPAADSTQQIKVQAGSKKQKPRKTQPGSGGAGAGSAAGAATTGGPGADSAGTVAGAAAGSSASSAGSASGMPGTTDTGAAAATASGSCTSVEVAAQLSLASSRLAAALSAEAQRSGTLTDALRGQLFDWTLAGLTGALDERLVEPLLQAWNDIVHCCVT